MKSTSSQIRKSFIDYFVKNNHEYVESSPLSPINDDTLLFTNAGMVQFKDIFLGNSSLKFSRAVSSQKCLRAGGKHNDLDNVGYTTRHHTFFEMLGNFSFGDYFKHEAINYAWDFLINELNISPDKLWVTIHKTDADARKIWLGDIDLDKNRLSVIDNDDNVYTTDFISGATYGLVAANSGTDQMLMKYDTDGNLVYRRFIGSTTSEAEFNSQSDNLHINKQNSIVLNMAASGVYGNVANMTIKIPNDGSLTSSSTYSGYVFTDTPYYTITNDSSSHTVANDTTLSVSSGNATITTSVYSTGNTTQSTSKITIS